MIIKLIEFYRKILKKSCFYIDSNHFLNIKGGSLIFRSQFTSLIYLSEEEKGFHNFLKLIDATLFLNF